MYIKQIEEAFNTIIEKVMDSYGRRDTVMGKSMSHGLQICLVTLPLYTIYIHKLTYYNINYIIMYIYYIISTGS